MSSGMLKSVRGIRVGLITTFDRTDIRAFTCMGTSVNFQILRSAETFITLKAMMRLLIRVRSDMDQHLIPRKGKMR